jgi:hypothetical protein
MEARDEIPSYRRQFPKKGNSVPPFTVIAAPGGFTASAFRKGTTAGFSSSSFSACKSDQTLSRSRIKRTHLFKFSTSICSRTSISDDCVHVMPSNSWLKHLDTVCSTRRLSPHFVFNATRPNSAVSRPEFLGYPSRDPLLARSGIQIHAFE